MLKGNLTKLVLSKILSNKFGFSELYSKKLTDDLVKIISHNIIAGNFNLKNVGTFKIINKKQRLGRTPKTKEEFIITARKSLIFVPSKKLIKYFH